MPRRKSKRAPHLVYRQRTFGTSSILAFSATTFPHQNRFLSFLAGIFGTAGLALSGWSQYSSNESHERIERLQAILLNLGLNTIPVDPDAAGPDRHPDIPTAESEDSGLSRHVSFL